MRYACIIVFMHGSLIASTLESDRRYNMTGGQTLSISDARLKVWYGLPTGAAWIGMQVATSWPGGQVQRAGQQQGCWGRGISYVTYV